MRRTLIVSGGILLGVGTVRVYRLIRSHLENPLFSPQFLVAVLSLWIAYAILRIGLQKNEFTLKNAISLIRSGSLLLIIWGYRFYMVQKTGSGPLMVQWAIVSLYMILGAVVMLLGLKVSRGLRKWTALKE